MAVEDNDRGWNDLGRAIEAFRGDPYVLVGIQGAKADTAHGDGLTVAQVASFNEFGTASSPERSFIRAAIDVNEKHLSKRLRQLGRGVLLEKLSRDTALQLLGEETRGLAIERINHRIDPPNAPSTIAAKGSSVPLIERGQLKNSITYKVVTG